MKTATGTTRQAGGVTNRAVKTDSTYTLPVQPLSGPASYTAGVKQQEVTEFIFPPAQPKTDPLLLDSDKLSDCGLSTAETVVQEQQKTLLWLPGSGQCPDNELIRRLLNACCEFLPAGEFGRQTGLSRVICSPYSKAESILEGLLRNNRSSRSEGASSSSSSVQQGDDDRSATARRTSRVVLVGGHSAGAGKAARLSHKYSIPSVTCGCAPPPTKDNLSCDTKFRGFAASLPQLTLTALSDMSGYQISKKKLKEESEYLAYYAWSSGGGSGASTPSSAGLVAECRKGLKEEVVEPEGSVQQQTNHQREEENPIIIRPNCHVVCVRPHGDHSLRWRPLTAKNSQDKDHFSGSASASLA